MRYQGGWRESSTDYIMLLDMEGDVVIGSDPSLDYHTYHVDKYREPNWDRYVVMLSSGIDDRNGNELYEGDIFNLLDEKGTVISRENTVDLADFLGGHYWIVNHDGAPVYQKIGNVFEPQLPRLNDCSP